MRRSTATLIFLFLVLGSASAAGAQQTGRCYPPPCAVEAPGASSAAQLPAAPVGSAVAADDLRSPAPFVGMGLLAVIGSLTLVTLRRRSHIVARSRGSRPVTVPPVAAPEPQPALR